MIDFSKLAGQIAIISGEGEKGTVGLYDGRRTANAIARRLTKERCDGERFARAVIQLEGNNDAAINLETGEYETWHAPKAKRGAPLLFAVKLRRVLVTLDEASIKRATKLGDGNLSAGIRKALARD